VTVWIALAIYAVLLVLIWAFFHGATKVSTPRQNDGARTEPTDKAA
jgi:hypothetical protein